MPYAELAVTTNFSFLRGASHPQEYVARAAELGLSAIGIADRNTLAGVVRAYAEAKNHPNLKLLVGSRLVTTDGFEVIAYPMDRAGYGRLCKLLSAGNLRARKGECRIAFEEIVEGSEGLVLIVMPPRRLSKRFGERLERFADAARGLTFLAGSHGYRGDEPRRLGRLAELARDARAPLVAVNDALYHAPERRPLQDVLACVREKCTVAKAGFRLEAHAERHLKSPEEMARLFAAHPEAVERTGEIVRCCDFSLGQLKYEYPDEPVPPGKTPQEHLEDLTWSRAKLRYGGYVPETVRAQVREELALIRKLEFARYFLTVHDIVQFAQDKDILCQGRGSAANSAVCYCLGITAVDPVDGNLLFARFLSEQRGEPPDIDVDFEHERREEVIQELYRRYGRERAAICSTVIHYRPRMAIREVGKALGLTSDVTAALADTVWGSWGDGLPEAHVRQAGLDPDNPAIAEAVALANELIGFPRHLSQHVGGFVLSREALDRTVPIVNGAMKDRTFIEWDKDDIDAIGMMKVDVLALGMLTCIRRGLDLLKLHYGLTIPTLADLPPSKEQEREVYEMLSRADSVGVFQVESRAQMSMLPRLKPKEFYDLVIEVAIVRPGPIQGDMVHPYLKRRESREEFVYPAPSPEHGPADELRKVLEKTKGVPLFQEQAMHIAMVAAKFSANEADGLRRAMATFRGDGDVHRFETRFIEGMVARGYDRGFAERCFKQIKGFGSYGFPESHAASFAKLVYVSAWIKCHHPDVFCAAILNSQPMGFYQPAQLVRDAREHGVEVRPPDVNESGWDCTLELAEAGPYRAVRLGLRQIGGLKKDEVERLLAAKGNGFRSVERIGRIPGVSRFALERLAEADAYRSLGLDRRAALWAVRGLDDSGRRRDGAAAHPAPLFAAFRSDDLFDEPAVALPAMPLSEQVAEDYIATGLSLRAHPVGFFRPMLRGLGAISAADHRSPALPVDSRVTVAGLVLMRQRPGTAKGVAFLTLEDETGIANVIVWRNLFEAERRIAMTSRFLAVRGRLQREGMVIHVLAESFLDLTGELPRLRDGEDTIQAFRKAPTSDAERPDSRLQKSRNFH